MAVPETLAVTVPERDDFDAEVDWKITLISSRFTHAESRYKPIEGELLAVTDALNKATFFVR